jgi:hypothetical protein
MTHLPKQYFSKYMDNWRSCSTREKRHQITVKGLTYIFVKMLAEPLIENLEDQLKAKDTGCLDRIEDLKEQLKVKDSQLEIIDSRMEDRLRSLEEQLRVKDSQLENKDGQLEKQAVHIQTLISQKAIEAPGAKKPWWRFW